MLLPPPRLLLLLLLLLMSFLRLLRLLLLLLLPPLLRIHLLLLLLLPGLLLLLLLLWLLLLLLMLPRSGAARRGEGRPAGPAGECHFIHVMKAQTQYDIQLQDLQSRKYTARLPSPAARAAAMAHPRPMDTRAGPATRRLRSS